jgi:hypothetical protein
MNWQQLRLGVNDRAVLIGRTGCGKTTLARYLIEDPTKKYSVVYDAKISDAIGQWVDTMTIYDNLGEIEAATEPRLIYRPPYTEERDPKAQDDFFEWIYFRYRTRLYIDEAFAILGGTRPSFHLGACITRGRERGISTVISTQRPHNIPQIFLTESESMYIFQLQGFYDRKRVEELTNGLVTVQHQMNLNQFEFFYYNVFSGLYCNREGEPQKLKLNL